VTIEHLQLGTTDFEADIDKFSFSDHECEDGECQHYLIYGEAERIFEERPALIALLHKCYSYSFHNNASRTFCFQLNHFKFQADFIEGVSRFGEAVHRVSS